MSDDRGVAAQSIACATGLYLRFVSEFGVAALVDGVLRIGPGASPDEVVTIACRRALQRAGTSDESAVAELVHAYGFDYVSVHVFGVVSTTGAFARVTARGAA